MNTTHRTKRPTINQLQAQATALEQQARELTKQLQLARGTRDLTPAVVEDPETAPTTQLYQAVKSMIQERPLFYRELLAALPGVNENRIKGVLTQLGRDDIGLVNLGTEARKLYFLPDPEVLRRLNAAAKGR